MVNLMLHLKGFILLDKLGSSYSQCSMWRHNKNHIIKSNSGSNFSLFPKGEKLVNRVPYKLYTCPMQRFSAASFVFKINWTPPTESNWWIITKGRAASLNSVSLSILKGYYHRTWKLYLFFTHSMLLTLGETTFISSFRKRNFPTSLWNRPPQFFMQASRTCNIHCCQK